MWKILEHLLPEKTYLAGCGHQTKQIDKVSAFGESGTVIIPITNGKTEYCHACLSKMAIRCAKCGQPIFIGSRITLRSLSGLKFVTPGNIYDQDATLAVCCGRRDCVNHASELCGTWIPPGKVRREPSLLEITMQNPDSVVYRDSQGTIIFPPSR